MGIYTESGWVNIPYIMEKYNPVVCVLAGGRGIGKTYNVLDYCFHINPGKYFYLRRTQEEIETCCNDELNPFILHRQLAETKFAVLR